MKIAVIGGDLRQLVMARELADDGFEVAIYGFDNCTSPCKNAVKCMYCADALRQAQIIILPVPYSKDNCKINCPYTKNELRVEELFEQLDNRNVVFAGLTNRVIEELAGKKKITVIDYMKSEELNILNAVPTAEGAIELAMGRMLTTLHGSKALVAGFGRIGKLLCRKLLSLGVEVTVAVRSSTAAAWVDTLGYGLVKCENIANVISDFDVVFNTVPSEIFTRNILKNVKEDVVIIDLASNPGGVDMQYAEDKGINALHALSLPGKTAPITSGRIIKKCICDIMKKRGIVE